MHTNKKNTIALIILCTVIISTIIIFGIIIYVKKRNGSTEFPSEPLSSESKTNIKSRVSESPFLETQSKKQNKKTPLSMPAPSPSIPSPSDAQARINNIYQTFDTSSVDSNIQALDYNLVQTFVSFERSTEQEEINNKKKILKQLFEQQTNKSHDDYDFGKFRTFINFIYDTDEGYTKKRDILNSFNDFKNFYTAAVSEFRKKSKVEIEAKDTTDLIIAEPEYIECIKEIDPELFEKLNIVKTNNGILAVLQNQTRKSNKIELFKALLRLRADSYDETEKIIKEADKKDISEILTVAGGALSMLYCFFGYHKLQMNFENVERSFEYVDAKTMGTVVLGRIQKPMLFSSFYLNENNSDSSETNLQNLLLGNKLDKKENGYEITIPIFLNAPLFLVFDLNILKIPITFQQNISLFSLEDKQTEYSLTGFLCTGFDGPKKKSKAFFKYKDQWQYFDNHNKIQRFKITSDLKTIYKEHGGMRVTQIFYTRDN
ncbi:hypothetical protein CDIK_2900 [Cucumispora dikerogammari]|nr:hypothetical protein CDIK_2900 [Cucumispora dikerogammari]